MPVLSVFYRTAASGECEKKQTNSLTNSSEESANTSRYKSPKRNNKKAEVVASAWQLTRAQAVCSCNSQSIDAALPSCILRIIWYLVHSINPTRPQVSIGSASASACWLQYAVASFCTVLDDAIVCAPPSPLGAYRAKLKLSEFLSAQLANRQQFLGNAALLVSLSLPLSLSLLPFLFKNWNLHASAYEWICFCCHWTIKTVCGDQDKQKMSIKWGNVNMCLANYAL